MLTCKQVSKTLSKVNYEDLSPVRKAMLKLHVKLCVFCGKFNRQVMESQDMCRDYKKHEECLAAHRPQMNESKKDELKELLAAHCCKGKDHG